MKSPLAFLAIALAPSLVLAQARPRPILYNGGFENVYQSENYWDGVDSDGFLTSSRGSAKAITERGTLDSIQMPMSVQVGDVNSDGLLDLGAVDSNGYFRVYFNSGTKTEPKFTHGELIPVYLSRFNRETSDFRHTLKANLFDFTRSGTLDLIIGNYGGEIWLLKNTGTPMAPEFRQPPSPNNLLVNTTKDGKIWGNLFAPVAWDWNRDGKPDLLIGEGSYSANAVHLLLNQGTPSVPRFTKETTYYAAFGDGREQLMPAVVDYNGDGFPDLLVGDSMGNVNVYLSDGAWSPGKELKFTSTVTFGRTAKFVGCVAVAAGDFNGDGLFDIVLGRTNGRISLALNKGTKEQPKFDTPVDIKGVDVWNRTTTRKPSDWSIDFGQTKGNFFGYTGVVDDKDPDAMPIPEGKNVLKAAYLPPLNKIIRFTPLVLGPSNDPEDIRHSPPNGFVRLAVDATRAGYNTDSNMLIIRKVLDGNQIKPAKNYTLSFTVKGRSVQNAEAYVYMHAIAQRDEAKFVAKGDRGGVQRVNPRVEEGAIAQQKFSVGQNWAPVTQNFNLTFAKNKDLNTPDTFQGVKKPTYTSIVEIRATLAPGQGVFLIDDVKIVER